MPDYTSIFQVLGCYARAFTLIDNLASRNLHVTQDGEAFRSLDRLRQEFIEVLNDSGPERDRLDAVAILTDAARVAGGWAAQLEQSLGAWLDAGLAAALNVEGAPRSEILRALAQAMAADNETVLANEVAIGAVQAAATNAGDARCYASLLTVDPEEDVVNDERARTQRVVLECIRDHARHRVPVGQEEFRIRPERGPAISARVIPVTYDGFDDARNVVRDGAFVADALEHWPAEAGAGVFSRDEAVALFGAASLKVTGDGSTAGELRQDYANRDPVLETGRLWALGAWVRVASHTAGTVTLDLLVDGEDSVAALVVDGDTPTGEWLHLAGFEYLPRAAFPNQVSLRVRCSADFDGVVNIDGVALAPAAELPHAGLRVALFQGPLAAQAGAPADRFVVDTTSDDAGKLQSFARDRLDVVLPSSDTPTVDDSLAE